MSTSPSEPTNAPAVRECERLVDELESHLDDLPPEALPPALVQRLLQATVRTYAAQRQAGACFGPYRDPVAVSATETIITVSNMLDAAELEVFELAACTTMAGA